MKPAQLRRAMLAGIAFIALFIAGTMVLLADTPETKSSETDAAQSQKWVTELSSSGHRAAFIIGAYLLILGGLAFVWFTAGLRAWLARGGDELSGRAITSLGVLGAGAMFVAAMLGASVAGSVTFGQEVVPQNGDAIRIVMGMVFPFLFVVFALVAAALIVVVVLAARDGGQLPGWLSRSAVLGVIGGVFGVIFFPAILMLLWLLALCIVVLKGAGSRAAADSAAAG